MDGERKKNNEDNMKIKRKKDFFFSTTKNIEISLHLRHDTNWIPFMQFKTSIKKIAKRMKRMKVLGHTIPLSDGIEMF